MWVSGACVALQVKIQERLNDGVAYANPQHILYIGEMSNHTCVSSTFLSLMPN